MHSDPGRRPSAAGLRDLLLAAVAEPAVAAAPGFAPEAAPARERLRLPLSVRGVARQAAPAVIVGWSMAWLLTVFPMYPSTWTLPVAGALAFLAWWHPRAAAAAGGVLAIPAFWNFAQAAGLVWIAAAAAWIWAAGHTAGGRERLLAPLWAGPLALIGFGTAFVFVAATAPTRGRRALEAGAGAVVAAVAGGWAHAPLVSTLPGASSPVVYARLLVHDPALVATAAALPAFAVLLAMARASRRRTESLALWGLGFALAAIGVPALLSHHPIGLGAEVATGLTAIIPAAWAVARPRRAAGG